MMNSSRQHKWRQGLYSRRRWVVVVYGMDRSFHDLHTLISLPPPHPLASAEFVFINVHCSRVPLVARPYLLRHAEVYGNSSSSRTKLQDAIAIKVLCPTTPTHHSRSHRAAMAPEIPNGIVFFGYGASPYARKVKQYLAFRNIAYAECVSLLSMAVNPSDRN